MGDQVMTNTGLKAYNASYVLKAKGDRINPFIADDHASIEHES